MSGEELSEFERLRQQLHDAQARAEAAENRSKHTALPTFLELCHTLFSEPLRVQTNRSLTTKGLIRSPRGKKHPTYLRP